MLNWIQNSFDIFYCNLKILSGLKNIKKIDNAFQKLGSDFANEYRGFLYFLEILIILTSYQLELLIADQDLLERIRWGYNNLNDPEFKKFLLTHKEASFLVQLHSLRRDFSTLREEYDEKKLQDKMLEINSLFFEIDLHLKEKHEIKRKVNSKKSEKLIIFDFIVRNYNWFRFGPINSDDVFDVDKEVPLHPGDLLTYLLPDKQRFSYFLHNSRIVKNNSDYFVGYKNTLLILYSLFFPENGEFIKRLFDGVSDWKGLQHAYSQIVDELDLKFDMNRQLYDLKEISIQNELKDQIENLEELRQTLRNREIRCFKDFNADFNIVLHYLFGAVKLSNCELRPELEVIQFDIIDSRESEKLAYYAIFNPTRGGLWDASYWIFFKSPYGYGDIDEMKSFVELLPEISSRSIRYKKIKISEKIIKDYYKQKDQSGQEKNRNQEIIKSCRGLLGEFFTLFYLIKKSSASQIVDIECHKDIKKTDIDVLIETEESIIIAQVKSFFSFDPDENRIIRNHFKQINEEYQNKNKKIIKILVCMDHEIHDSEIAFLIDEKMKKKKQFAITDHDIEDYRTIITREFAKEKITVMYRMEIQEQLKIEKGYDVLITSLNKIFSSIEEDDLLN